MCGVPDYEPPSQAEEAEQEEEEETFLDHDAPGLHIQCGPRCGPPPPGAPPPAPCWADQLDDVDSEDSDDHEDDWQQFLDEAGSPWASRSTA